jgi:hypothetical protein
MLDLRQRKAAFALSIRRQAPDRRAMMKVLRKTGKHRCSQTTRETMRRIAM